jgi:hypothetical protein
MHVVRPSRSCCKAAICASSRGRQLRDSLAQSALVGVRESGSVERASRISSSESPTLRAARTKARRRRTDRGYRRCPPDVRDGPLPLVEPDGGRGETGALRDLTDQQQLLGHEHHHLDMKLTSTYMLPSCLRPTHRPKRLNGAVLML